MISPIAIVVVIIPVVLAFLLGIVIEKLRHLPGEVTIPVATLKIKKKKYLPTEQGEIKRINQQLEWRGHLAGCLHQHWPLNTKQLEELVIRIEQMVFDAMKTKEKGIGILEDLEHS